MCGSLVARAFACACMFVFALAPQEMVKSDKYKLEVYWTKKTIGFRQKTGEKKQLFSIGGTTTCKLSMDTLIGWASETLKKLDTSRSWEAVRDWVKAQIDK